MTHATPRDELEQAFSAYVHRVGEITRSGQWSVFADLFTEDATYCEHVYGDFTGREEIRNWVVRTMTSFPGDTMVDFPPAWHVLDPESSRVVCEIRNLMPDPGDGSVHEASNITILTYAGNGLWSREEDVYNPARFGSMVRDWARVAREHGRLSPEGQAMLAHLEQ